MDVSMYEILSKLRISKKLFEFVRAGSQIGPHGNAIEHWESVGF